MASPTTLVASVQIETMRSWRSSSVMSPRSYSRPTLATSSSKPTRICSFSLGITMSFFEIVIPARVANRKVSDLMTSSAAAIVFGP